MHFPMDIIFVVFWVNSFNEIFTNLKLSNDIFYENIRSTSKEDGTWYKTKEYSIIALGEKE